MRLPEELVLIDVLHVMIIISYPCFHSFFSHKQPYILVFFSFLRSFPSLVCMLFFCVNVKPMTISLQLPLAKVAQLSYVYDKLNSNKVQLPQLSLQYHQVQLDVYRSFNGYDKPKRRYKIYSSYHPCNITNSACIHAHPSSLHLWLLMIVKASQLPG